MYVPFFWARCPNIPLVVAFCHKINTKMSYNLLTGKLCISDKSVMSVNVKQQTDHGKLFGLCGGGGYAISLVVLQRLFSHFESQEHFYDTYMMINSLTHYSDITTSFLLNTFANATLAHLEGIHPWVVDLDKYFSSNQSKENDVPILTLHYASGRMQQYIDVVNSQN